MSITRGAGGFIPPPLPLIASNGSYEGKGENSLFVVSYCSLIITNHTIPHRLALCFTVGRKAESYSFIPNSSIHGAGIRRFNLCHIIHPMVTGRWINTVQCVRRVNVKRVASRGGGECDSLNKLTLKPARLDCSFEQFRPLILIVLSHF